jgi:hypothetical protein
MFNTHDQIKVGDEAMRYFFELIDGINLPDLTGMECADDTAAIQEGRHRAIHHSQAQRRQRYGGYGSVRVRDEKGRIVADVPID